MQIATERGLDGRDKFRRDIELGGERSSKLKLIAF